MNVGMKKSVIQGILNQLLYLLCRYFTLTFIYYPGLTIGKISISAETSLKVRNIEGILDEFIITDEATEMNKKTK